MQKCLKIDKNVNQNPIQATFYILALIALMETDMTRLHAEQLLMECLIHPTTSLQQHEL